MECSQSAGRRREQHTRLVTRRDVAASGHRFLKPLIDEANTSGLSVLPTAETCRLRRDSKTRAETWPSARRQSKNDGRDQKAGHRKPRRRRRSPRPLTTTPGHRARSRPGKAVAGDAGLFPEVPGQARLRAECARRLCLRHGEARSFRRHVQRPDAGAERALQARARDDRGRRVVAEPLLLLPDRARRRRCGNIPAIRCSANRW